MPSALPQPLTDGLLLRCATPADADKLASFNATIHSDDGPDQPEEALAIWTRDLLTRPHPTFKPELATVVEDTATGQIVSTALLIPQTWTFAGIPIGVGQPELIATHPDYRNRGLVRRQMDVLHQFSARLGHQMQAIMGIPWYYRQFGYEMGLDMGGGRMVSRPDIPSLKSGEHEKFSFRKAGMEDIPFIRDTYDQASAEGRFSCSRDPALWAYELNGRTPGSLAGMEIRIIETGEGLPVGMILFEDSLWGKNMGLKFAALNGNASWREVTPALMRYMLDVGDGYTQEKNGPACTGLKFALINIHPVFKLFPNTFSRPQNPYAWYVRFTDLPDFIRRITPFLDRRLSASDFKHYSGDVMFNFYRSGLKLTLTDGRLTASEPWQPGPDQGGQVRFPDLTFLSLLCGRRSFTELSEFFPDCYARNDEITALLDVLFPKQSSNVWGVR